LECCCIPIEDIFPALSPEFGLLKRAWQRWLRIAEVIAEFNSRVVLTLFYAIIVLPFGLVVRLFADPLAIKKTRISAWSEIRYRTRTLDEGKRQF
jgi:hypothetical protein|tara:strand:- start:289 stop:573 length:285 start_codon:yes stop_codon:yes gene_type:complete